QHHVSESCYPEKVFLSAPPIGLGGAMGQIVKYLPVEIFSGLAKIPFSVPLPDMVDLTLLSHDVRVTEAYIQDDFTLKKLHSKLLIELVKTSKQVFSRPLNITCPVTCVVGGADEIVDLASIKNYFSSIDKSSRLKVVEGAYHEMHNEVGRYREPFIEIIKEFFTAP
ncbi:MAG: hypothetical protein HN623_07505, partial [Bdellovibrionales bacterium]|nr:hypothetical protein [Bdellovibrionales bacterium]